MTATTNNINPIALRKAKIAYNFGLSECNRVKHLKPVAESYILDKGGNIFYY